MRDYRDIRRIAIGFALLFAAYQLPEGIGQRLLGSFPLQAALLLMFFPIAYFVGRSLAPRALQAYALEPRRGLAGVLAVCFVLAVALKVASVFIGQSYGIVRFNTSSAASTPGLLQSLAVGLLFTFAPSLAEDIVTRGFWYRASRILRTPVVFVVASAAIYVVNHIYRLALGPSEWLMLFVFGVTYAIAVVRFDSLWPAVGLHWGWNYGNALVATVMPVAVLSADGSRVLAVAAHGVMLIGLLWLPRFMKQQPTPA